jgi:ubiquinone/menaquinone biosynthesis C-methylase UbiE
MARILAEQRFQAPITDAERAAIGTRLDLCLAVRNSARRGSTVAGDGLRVLHELEAPDAQSIREAFRISGLAYERVWAADPKSAEASASDSNDEATAAWNGVLFDKFVRFREILTRGFTRHSDAALAHHPVARGARVLDIGCGFGDVTAVLARAVGPEGGAVGVDVAERFVEAARRDAEAEGLPNASFFRADVQRDDLRGPYEVVFSRFGTMFFANPVAALRNARTVLAPGGTFCMVVWRRREDNDWVHAAEKVVRELVPERHDSGEPTCGPGPFSMASADTTTDILTHAGFRDIALLRHDAPVRIGRDLDEAVAFAMDLGPAGEVLRLAGEEGERRRPAVVRALREALAPYARGEGVVMPSSVWIVTARK